MCLAIDYFLRKLRCWYCHFFSLLFLLFVDFTRSSFEWIKREMKLNIHRNFITWSSHNGNKKLWHTKYIYLQSLTIIIKVLSLASQNILPPITSWALHEQLQQKNQNNEIKHMVQMYHKWFHSSSSYYPMQSLMPTTWSIAILIMEIALKTRIESKWKAVSIKAILLKMAFNLIVNEFTNHFDVMKIVWILWSSNQIVIFNHFPFSKSIILKCFSNDIRWTFKVNSFVLQINK